MEVLSEWISACYFFSLTCFLAHCFHQTWFACIRNYQSQLTVMDLHNLTCAQCGVAQNSTFQHMTVEISFLISDISGRCYLFLFSGLWEQTQGPIKAQHIKGAASSCRLWSLPVTMGSRLWSSSPRSWFSCWNSVLKLRALPLPTFCGKEKLLCPVMHNKQVGQLCMA